MPIFDGLPDLTNFSNYAGVKEECPATYGTRAGRQDRLSIRFEGK
jgi:hypothetical protein